jgi:hypothetical protein
MINGIDYVLVFFDAHYRIEFFLFNIMIKEFSYELKINIMIGHACLYMACISSYSGQSLDGYCVSVRDVSENHIGI